ncbi:TPA: hypothetical protein NJ378_004566 [Vibrio parahaemolyticus]|nr:hypothetical protein [Vibrio parahaemolyticus]
MSDDIKIIADRLKPHMEELDTYFQNKNSDFRALMETNHDELGRVLKCHLVIEHYLTIYFSNHYGIDDIDQIRLSFAQKVNLLPDKGSAVSYVKKGIERVNKIRNRFGHKLDATICNGELNELDDVLKIMRPEVGSETPINRIENFTAIACTFLNVAPKEIEEIFSQAFKNVQV